MHTHTHRQIISLSLTADTLTHDAPALVRIKASLEIERDFWQYLVSCPQPDANHLARWLGVLLSPPALDVRFDDLQLQVLQVQYQTNLTLSHTSVRASRDSAMYVSKVQSLLTPQSALQRAIERERGRARERAGRGDGVCALFHLQYIHAYNSFELIPP